MSKQTSCYTQPNLTPNRIIPIHQYRQHQNENAEASKRRL